MESHRHALSCVAPVKREASLFIALAVERWNDHRPKPAFRFMYILSSRDQGRLQCGLQAANANDTVSLEHGQRGARCLA